MKFDTYTLQARVLPATLLLLPAFLEINYIIVAIGFKLVISTTIANLILLVVLMVFANLVRYFGRKKEKKLFTAWGGAPTTRFLRYSNTEFNSYKKEEIRKYLKIMCNHIKMPTRQEEIKDLKSCDNKYEAYVANIQALTRDTKKFNLLYCENKNYGMWRNLYGVKLISIILLAVLTAVNVALAIWVSSVMNIIAAGVLDGVFILLLLVWIFVVNKSKIKDVAECYAQKLFEAVIVLNNQKMNSDNKTT